jgi:hypothetical protein
MALTLESSTETDLNLGSHDISGNGPAVYVAAFDLDPLVGCTLRLTWGVTLNGDSVFAKIWNSGVLTPTNTGEPMLGYVTPPIPVISSGQLNIELLSGTPSGVLTVDLYRL